MEVKLYKKEGTYFSQDKQKDVPYVNFYVKCNDALIPVEVKYFPNKNFNDRDPGYSGRMAVMSAFAEILPEIIKEESARDNNARSDVPPPTDSDVPVKK